MSTSAGWQNLAGTVSENGVNLTENFDLAAYIKGDTKPATIYSAELLLDYEEIAIQGVGEISLGTSGNDWLAGQGGNAFTGGEGNDLFILSYGAKNPGEIVGGSVISDFMIGEDVIGLIGLSYDQPYRRVIAGRGILTANRSRATRSADARKSLKSPDPAQEMGCTSLFSDRSRTSR
jgi:hypothetical protein